MSHHPPSEAPGSCPQSQNQPLPTSTSTSTSTSRRLPRVLGSPSAQGLEIQGTQAEHLASVFSLCFSSGGCHGAASADSAATASSSSQRSDGAAARQAKRRGQQQAAVQHFEVFNHDSYTA